MSSHYFRIPNYIVDDGFLAEMTGNALKCYVAIDRFTCGFSRSNWALSSSFLMKKTGIKSEETMVKAIRSLEQLQLVRVLRTIGEVNKFSVCHPQGLGVAPINTPTPKNSVGTTPKNSVGTTPKNMGSIKENIKENIKESIYVRNAHDQDKNDQILVEQKLEAERLEKQKAEQEAKAQSEAKAEAKSIFEKQVSKNFELFWSAYPNKKSKKEAEVKFKRIDFKKHTFESIMSSLEKQKQSQDWIKNGGQYVPMPTTWINQERWADEVQVPVQQPSHTDVNSYWADKLHAQAPIENFVPTLVLGEEFN